MSVIIARYLSPLIVLALLILAAPDAVCSTVAVADSVAADTASGQDDVPVLQKVVITGNTKTRTAVILREIDTAFFRPATQLLDQARLATAGWPGDDELAKTHTTGNGHALEPVNRFNLDSIQGHSDIRGNDQVICLHGESRGTAGIPCSCRQ